MIDQDLFVLWKILRAHIFDGFQFFIVTIINTTIVLLNFLGGELDITLKSFDFCSLHFEKLIFETRYRAIHVCPDLIEFIGCQIHVFGLIFIKLVYSFVNVIFAFSQLLIRELSVFLNFLLDSVNVSASCLLEVVETFKLFGMTC